MPLPSDLHPVVVTGSSADLTGAALPGKITFTPSTTLTDTTGRVVVYPLGRTYQFTAGQFTTDPLAPTDATTLSPAGQWEYTVRLELQNLPPATYSVLIPAAPFSFTATNAAPCVFTATGSAYANGNAVTLTGGSLPAGFTAGTTYYVVSASGTSFSLAATSGGSAIASTSTGSGTVATATLDLSALTQVSSPGTPSPFLLAGGGTMTGELVLAASPPLKVPGATSGQILASDGSGNFTPGAAAGQMTATAVKTAAYSAVAGDYVRCDTTTAWNSPSAGLSTVTLPNAPAAGTVVGVKLVASAAAVNPVTVACAGSDVINKAGGAVTYALPLLNQGATFQYNGGVWLVQNDDLPLSQLDNRYPDVFNVKSFGAQGNGAIASDGAVTASSTTITSASLVPFAGARTAWIPGAGAAGGLLTTTITCTAAGTGTLGAASSATLSGRTFWWGTDDTTALQAAITAATPSAGTVLLPQGLYLVSAPLSVTLANPGGTNNPQAAPSILGQGGAGFIGDQGLGQAGPVQYATALAALPTFTQGKFLIDYPALSGAYYGAAGARVGGFSVICGGFSAGVRFQGTREFHVAHMTIVNAALPVSPGDNANGGFSVTFPPAGGNAGAYNLFEHITVWVAAGDCFYTNTNSEDTYVACRAYGAGNACYNVTGSGLSTYVDCHYGACVYGVSMTGGSSPTFIGLSLYPGIGWPAKNALLLAGGWQYNLSQYYPPAFVNCRFINDPAASPAEADGAPVRLKAQSTYYMNAVFTGCYISTGSSGHMSDWLYSDAGISGGLVTFRDCVFGGTPNTRAYNDQSGVMQFFNCTGVGVPSGSGGLAPVGGSPHVIAAQTLAAPGTITFSAIPQGYSVLRVLVLGASAVAAEADEWYIQLNGDTANHYDTQDVHVSSTAGAIGGSTVTAGVWRAAAGDMPGASATAGVAGVLDVEIPAYAGTTFQKTGLWRSGYSDGAAGGGDAAVVEAIVKWRSTAAVTSVKIGAIGGNLVTGTTALLYAT
jgi:hypothetical protein